MKPTFTLGIEEEYQTVDPETRDLRSHIHAEIIEKGKLLSAGAREGGDASVRGRSRHFGLREYQRSEGGTEESSPPHDPAFAQENGLRLASAATHPFADWRVQEVTPDERYKNIVQDMQLVARANLIFGLHVHVGVEDRETSIHLMNHARYFVPHLLALVHELAILAGHGHGTEILSLQSVRQISAHQSP